MKENKGNTGSAVSTAVGEPVALLQEVADVLAEQNWRGDLVERLRDTARLAAPTQAKPVDLSGLTRYTVRTSSMGAPAWMEATYDGGYVKLADVERLSSAPTQVSAPTDELKQLRNRVSQLEAARIGYASEFPMTADGEPDVGNIHANIRALKAQVSAPNEEILSLHRRLAAEVLHAQQGWERAEAKSRECIELRERMAQVSAPQAAELKHLPGWERGIATVTMSGHQLREALDFINPDGDDDEDQRDNELTFGIAQHRDDNGEVATGLCCWNDDTDGVLPLDGEPVPRTVSAPQASAAQEVLHEDVEWLLEAVDMARRNPEHATKIRANCKAGAAQKVRAVPEGDFLPKRDVADEIVLLSNVMREHPQLKSVIGREALLMRCVRQALAAPTSTSTAPAAMDEKGGE